MNRRLSLVALMLSGLLWGCSAPLTKVALGALPPEWLAAVRFGLAAVPLLWIARRRLRGSVNPAVVVGGALGYGAVVALWNEGLLRTSVSHGALMAGVLPAMVALVALMIGRGSATPRAWIGFGLALAGIALVASGGGNASATGDLLALSSTVVSAAFTVWQAQLLRGRDPVAVTAVQFTASALFMAPVAALTDGTAPGHGAGPAAWLAVGALVVTGTVLPFTLFAWAQVRTTPEVAGAFLNLEPVIGAVAGALLFGDPLGGPQLVGGAAVILGIALSALPGGPVTRFVVRLAHRAGAASGRERSVLGSRA